MSAGQFTAEQQEAAAEYGLAEHVVTNPHPSAYCDECGAAKEWVANLKCFICDPATRPCLRARDVG